jgi:hypothetical protein
MILPKNIITEGEPSKKKRKIKREIKTTLSHCKSVNWKNNVRTVDRNKDSVNICVRVSARTLYLGFPKEKSKYL